MNLFLHYVGWRRVGKGFADGEPLPKILIAANSQIGSIDAVNKRFKQLVRRIKDELERRDWIEGENTAR